MEFRFNINDYIKQEITKIKNNLLPEDFVGDRRSAGLCTAVISEILDEMGLASAKAQGLLKPITSAERLRNTEHIVYLLTEPDANKGKGSVVGLLKMGWKKLYVFDAAGLVHEKDCLCVLDFYVHESRQRKGYGKKLFEFMLNDEHVAPHQLAIDKPSQKFLAFLYRHYGLEKILPQTNNFVLFDGFFSDSEDSEDSIISKQSTKNGLDQSIESTKKTSSPNLNFLKSENFGLPYSIYGRNAAYKPQSTIGKIIQPTTGSFQTPKRSGV